MILQHSDCMESLWKKNEWIHNAFYVDGDGDVRKKMRMRYVFQLTM